MGCFLKMRSISRKVQTLKKVMFFLGGGGGGGGGAKLCRPFLVSCNIGTMLTRTIGEIHRSWCTQTVQPHNVSTIHAFLLPIFCLAIGESPLNKFFVRWDHGKDMLDGMVFWTLSWCHTSVEMYFVD